MLSRLWPECSTTPAVMPRAGYRQTPGIAQHDISFIYCILMHMAGQPDLCFVPDGGSDEPDRIRIAPTDHHHGRDRCA